MWYEAYDTSIDWFMKVLFYKIVFMQLSMCTGVHLHVHWTLWIHMDQFQCYEKITSVSILMAWTIIHSLLMIYSILTQITKSTNLWHYNAGIKEYRLSWIWEKKDQFFLSLDHGNNWTLMSIYGDVKIPFHVCWAGSH